MTEPQNEIEPQFEAFYPTAPRHGFTADQAREYATYFPGTLELEPEGPDALTALNLALEAIEAGNHHPKETP